MRATKFSRPGRAEYRSRSRPVSPRYCASTSALRDSNPDSGVPSFTHSLRMRCASRSADSRATSGSVSVTLDLSRDRLHAVDEHAFLLPPLGTARVHEMLEMSERLALCHRAPVPLREHLVRQ